MSRRRTLYRSLPSLQRDNRVCRACCEAGFPLESRPIFEGRPGQRAMIFGQAPGLVEADERRPWRGRAGRTLRDWLGMDEDEFYGTFYCSSVTRCYPGRGAGGRGDRTPAPREVALCRFWREWELRLLRPELILTVGGMAARELLGLSRLAECVGTEHRLGEALVVPLPHPSGASGWLNDPANRELLVDALGLVRSALARLPG